MRITILRKPTIEELIKAFHEWLYDGEEGTVDDMQFIIEPSSGLSSVHYILFIRWQQEEEEAE